MGYSAIHIRKWCHRTVKIIALILFVKIEIYRILGTHSIDNYESNYIWKAIEYSNFVQEWSSLFTVTFNLCMPMICIMYWNSVPFSVVTYIVAGGKGGNKEIDKTLDKDIRWLIMKYFKTNIGNTIDVNFKPGISNDPNVNFKDE